MDIRIEKHDELQETHFYATVVGDEWVDAQNKATAKLAKKVTIKGFRKGMAPVSMASKYLREADILNDAADKAVAKAYDELLKRQDIEVFMQPELVVNDFSKDKLSFYFKVISRPNVTLGEYKNIDIPKAEISVSEEDINNEIQDLVKKNAEMVVAETDYEAVKGDTAVIDFKGYVDNKPFDGGEASSYELEIGSHTFVPGFEEQLVGVKTNDDKDVIIVFPENYVAELANKTAIFKVHVNAVKKKVYPSVDDDFAKDLDIKDVDTIEQLKEHLKGQIFDRKVKADTRERVEKLLTTITDNASFTCHSKIIDEETNRIFNDFKRRVEQQGFGFDDYLTITKKTADDVRNEASVQANISVKRAYVLDAIAKNENIEATEVDLDNRLSEMSKAYNQSVEDLKKQLGDRLNSFKYAIREDKIMDFLKANNNIIEEIKQ